MDKSIFMQIGSEPLLACSVTALWVLLCTKFRVRVVWPQINSLIDCTQFTHGKLCTLLQSSRYKPPLFMVFMEYLNESHQNNWETHQLNKIEWMINYGDECEKFAELFSQSS